MSLKRVLLLVNLLCFFVDCKVYDRCELANELKTVHKIPDKELATWVCIARHESEYNTTAVGHLNWDGSGDHGLFQISDLYWCSPPGKGWACGVTCQQLEDDDIEDDVACIKRIHRQHQRLSGDGFSAWAVYRAHCSADQVGKYIEGCFNASENSDSNNEVIKSEDKKIGLIQTDDKKKNSVFEPASIVIQDVDTNEALVKPVNNFVQNNVKIVRPVVNKQVGLGEAKPEIFKEAIVKTGLTKTESKPLRKISDGIVKSGFTGINTGRNIDTLDKTKTKPIKRFSVKLYEFGSNVGL